MRKRVEKLELSQSADAEIKKKFFELFNQEYTTKKLTQAEQAQSDIKSIYSLNIDEVNTLNKMVKEYSELARETRLKTETEKQTEIDYQVKETKDIIEAGDA